MRRGETGRPATSASFARGLTGLLIFVLIHSAEAREASATGTAGVPFKLKSSSAALVEEVLSESSDPHRYDWRRISLQFEGGYSLASEQNSFESSGFGLGLARSIGRGLLARLAWRHVETRPTTSSQLIALTPFSQAGQPSRDEFLVGVGYALFEGRSSTPLSPRLTDVGHALFFLGGVQYNLFGSNAEIIPGMRPVQYAWVAETGLRFQVFLPHAVGLSVEWTYSMPVSGRDPDLPSWQRLGGNVSWAFGD